MAFGKKPSKSSGGSSSSKGNGEKAQWRRILEVCEGKESGKMYAKASGYKGYLLWVEFSDVDEQGEPCGDRKVYKVLTANIFDRKENAPEWVQNEIVINLTNEKSAVELED